MRATSGVFKGLNPTVTVASKILVISFVLFCVLQAEQAGKAFEMVSGILLQNVKWFYLGLLTAILGFLFYLMIGRFAHIRLGKIMKTRVYLTGWISMLFSGGMGVGLVFWSAAEPMWHYASNPLHQG